MSHARDHERARDRLERQECGKTSVPSEACKLGGCCRLAALALFHVRWQTAFQFFSMHNCFFRLARSEMGSQTVQPSASASDSCSDSVTHSVSA